MTGLISGVARLHLAQLPTPIEPMPRLTAYLGGPQLFVKRDDLTGLGLGGNKVRKLEFVLPEAEAMGADTIICAGVTQSNTVRQVAAAAAKLGYECHCLIIGDRIKPEQYRLDDEYARSGNYLLDGLFGMHPHHCSIHDNRDQKQLELADQLRLTGKVPFVIPYGISNARGALGYVNFVIELASQLGNGDVPEQFDYMVHASGSAGTQAGLVVGTNAIIPGLRIVGIDVDADADRVHRDVVRVARATASLLGCDQTGLADLVTVLPGYAGPAYGVPTAEMVEAIRLFARLEGLVLDPVYSGKGAAGLIGLVRGGYFKPSERVLFLHTGGWPALFSYASLFPV